MMLDNRNANGESLQGIILLNLYSDDGLVSIDNSALWDKFMLDFKKVFDVVEKDPDYVPYTSSSRHEDLCKRELGWRRKVQKLVSAILWLHQLCRIDKARIELLCLSDMQGNEHADRGKPPSCSEHFEVCHRVHR
jgi:hypothetical protein